jgi:hypothetical protein
LSLRQWCAAVSAALLLAVTAFVGGRTVRTEIDTVTATTATATQTYYPFGITLGPPEVAPSDVEKRMTSIGASWTPRWRYFHSQEYRWFGLDGTDGCGWTPPSFQLNHTDGRLLAGLTDAEVVALVRVLESGTPARAARRCRAGDRPPPRPPPPPRWGGEDCRRTRVSPLPIDYAALAASPLRPLRPWRLSRRRKAIVVALAAVTLAVGAFFGEREVRTDIEAVTGSTTTSTHYPFGIVFSPPDVQTTAFELRLRAMGATWRPRWQNLSTKTYSLFGLSIARGSSRSPASYELKYVNAPLLAGLTNTEVAVLARVMETGTPAEQDDAIRSLIDTIFSRDPSVPTKASAAGAVAATATSAGR